MTYSHCHSALLSYFINIRKAPVGGLTVAPSGDDPWSPNRHLISSAISMAGKESPNYFTVDSVHGKNRNNRNKNERF